LDSISSKYISEDSNIFIKIDTQGYEDLVLKGACETIKKATGLQLEVSLVPLYEGQTLYADIIDKMKTFGFNIWGLSTVLIDTKTGRLLQVDAVFFRD